MIRFKAKQLVWYYARINHCSTLVIRFKAKLRRGSSWSYTIVAPLWLDSRQNEKAKAMMDEVIVAPLWLDSRQNDEDEKARKNVIVAPLWLDSRQNRFAVALTGWIIVAPLWLDSRQNYPRAVERNWTKISTPNGEKEGKGFIVWTKIVYHNVCMANIDKGQEGVENLIEARNKYRMLRIRKATNCWQARK